MKPTIFLAHLSSQPKHHFCILRKSALQTTILKHSLWIATKSTPSIKTAEVIYTSNGKQSNGFIAYDENRQGKTADCCSYSGMVGSDGICKIPCKTIGWARDILRLTPICLEMVKRLLIPMKPWLLPNLTIPILNLPNP